ncbi:hypothetical protein Osc1_14910 [Hominimerdicola sp. 21CYCFAH17_S]|mgnify:FL=1
MKLQKQITNEELLELTKKAFENDEVAEFLCGENGYSVMGNRDIPTNIPTDFGRIVEKGIYIYYKNTNDETIVLKTKQALLKLIKGTPINVWVAFMIIRRQFNKYDKNLAPFKIEDENILFLLKNALRTNEVQLRNCKKFLGTNCENGLWQNILRIDNNYKEDMGVSLI